MNTHNTKKTVDNFTVFAKWCGKENETARYAAYLLGLMIISVYFMFDDYIFGNQLMIFQDIGSDTWQQYIMNYSAIVNDLRDGSFSLWDFSNGFGVNMFNFNLFDPFLLLLYGLGVVLGPAHMLLYINMIQIIKMLAAGMVFFWFLSQFTLSSQAKLISAYVYGFSGYLLVWGQHYQFGTAVIYLPLLLLFCEKYIQKKKGRGFFPVMVFFCGIYSVYFTYMCLAVTGLYLLFRILMLDGLTWKQRLTGFLTGCGEILLGIGMSLMVLLPMAEVLLNVSSRLDSSGISFWSWIRQCFTPYNNRVYGSMIKHLFSSNLQNGAGMARAPQQYVMNYYEDPILFCSTLAVFLNIQFLVVLRKTELSKRAKAVLYSAMMLIFVGMLFPIGGTVFNYFTKPTQRYTFVLVPFFLLLMAWMWDYLKKGGRTSIILILGVSAVMAWAYMEGWEQAVFPEHKRNIQILIVTGILTVLCLILLDFVKEKNHRGIIMGILCIVLSVNVISEGRTNFQARVTMKITDTPMELMEEKTAQYEQERISKDKAVRYRAELNKPQSFFRDMYRADIPQVLAYLKERDPSFFRVEKDYISGTVAMDASAQGYDGISAYNSVMNGNIKEFVEICCPELFYADQNHYTFWNHVDEGSLAAFFGIRYLISGQKIPQEGWKMLNQIGGIYVHENERKTGTAHFYTDAVSEDSFKELCTEETRDSFLENVIALPQDGEEIHSLSEIKELISKEDKKAMEASEIILDRPEKDSHITGTVHAEKDGYGLFMIPYEKGWSLTIDGKETELIRGDIGFLACEIPEGNHTLVLDFQAPGLKAGIAASIVFWMLFAVSRVMMRRVK